MLGQADYREAMYGNRAFQIFLTDVFTSKTVLFLGCSLTDPVPDGVTDERYPPAGTR